MYFLKLDNDDAIETSANNEKEAMIESQELCESASATDSDGEAILYLIRIYDENPNEFNAIDAPEPIYSQEYLVEQEPDCFDDAEHTFETYENGEVCTICGCYRENEVVCCGECVPFGNIYQDTYGENYAHNTVDLFEVNNLWDFDYVLKTHDAEYVWETFGVSCEQLATIIHQIDCAIDDFIAPLKNQDIDLKGFFLSLSQAEAFLVACAKNFKGENLDDFLSYKLSQYSDILHGKNIILLGE